MDTDQVIAAAQAAAGASVNILNLIGVSDAHQGDLEDIAVELAIALNSILAWMPARDGQANQLLGATATFLP